MKFRILITIVGDQLAPSLLFLRDHQFQNADHFVFITTELMESRGKVDNLSKALDLPPDRYRKVIISPDNPEIIIQQLGSLDGWELPGEYHVNLSSGSKIMAIGVFNFFANGPLRDCCHLYYMSIYETHFLEIFPEAGRKIPMRNEVRLEEYLISYGIGVLQLGRDAALVQPPDYTHQILQLFLSPERDGSEFYRFKEKIRKEGESIDLKQASALADFLREINFSQPSEDNSFTFREYHYLRGGWWEEWVYAQIKERLKLPDYAIATGVQIEMDDQKGRRVNYEFDIMFLYRNALYVVECKTGLGVDHEVIKTRLDEELHRLAAVRRVFGMNAHTCLFTLSDRLRRKPTSPGIRNIFGGRAELLFIRLLDRFDYLSGEWLEYLVGKSRQ